MSIDLYHAYNITMFTSQVVGEGKDMTLLQLNPQELEPLKITVIY